MLEGKLSMSRLKEKKKPGLGREEEIDDNI